ncbi:MAG TPA: hypothetical protein VGQ04_08100 [Chitinophagaceae bacterium]|jgi:hypothetical protein|nr:hypothetical protein [Chitinophagaceae bacterium]
MNSTRKFFTVSLLIAALTFANLVTAAQAQGQICKDNFNHALGFYNRGQFENVNTYVKDCIDNIKNSDNHGYYKGNGQTIVLKVYKICISSFRNLEQGNLAEQKLTELMSYLNLSREQAERRLNETPLTPIE